MRIPSLKGGSEEGILATLCIWVLGLATGYNFPCKPKIQCLGFKTCFEKVF